MLNVCKCVQKPFNNKTGVKLNFLFLRINVNEKLSTMKKLLSIVALVALFSVSTAFAQKKTEEIKIKTSAQCGMCKTRIETAMAYEKGVTNSDLNLEDKVLTVTYKPGKTTPEKIRKAINAIGYDADDTFADPKAYAALSPCCKKPDDPEHVDH